jgi:lysophospholipase L1-like esterase
MNYKNRLLRLYISALSLGLAYTAAAHEGADSTAFYMQQARQQKVWQARALVNKGNDARLRAVMLKAMAGDTVTMGVIGGSITAGASAADFGKTAYAPLVLAWWKKAFPKAHFRFVNAGIGATNSVYGVHRADRDLLQHRPDFVMIEFSVNDHGEKEAQESYEGLVRKVLKSPAAPAVIALGMMNQKGANWQDQHLPVCKHYDIPYLSYRDALWPEIAAGRLTWKNISPDDVHPNDRGHAYAAGLVTAYLEGVCKRVKRSPSAPVAAAIPAPLTANGYEVSQVLLPTDLKGVDLGSFQQTGDSWVGSRKGQPLVLEVEAACMWVNFMRTNKGNGGKVDVHIDGRFYKTLDADFAGGWGDYLQATPLFKEKEPRKHRVSFYFQDDESKTFLIRNVLVAKY